MYTNLVGDPSCYIPFKEFSNVELSFTDFHTFYNMCTHLSSEYGRFRKSMLVL